MGDQLRFKPFRTQLLILIIVVMGTGPLTPLSVLAADESAAKLPEMEVTGELDEWEIRLNRLTPTSGITREQFETLPDSGRLGDVINRMPSVFMGGPPGENKDIRLRGMDKEFTRFEFDGLQLPGGGEKREFQVNRLSPFSIGKITILRNPNSEYESDGIAGRIIADLRPIPRDLKIDYRLGFGGFDSLDGDQRSISVGIGQRVNQRFGFNLFLDYNRFPLEKEKTKQSKKFKADGSLKETTAENEDEEKPNDSYSAILDMAYFYNQGEVHFKPLWLSLEEDKDKTKLKTKIDDKGKTSKEKELEDEKKEQTTWGATLSNEHRWGSRVKLESDVSYMTTQEDKDKTKPKFKANPAGVFSLDKTEVEDEEKEDEFWQFRSKLTRRIDSGFSETLKTGFHIRLRDRFRAKDKVTTKKDGKIDPKGGSKPKDSYSLEEDYFAGFFQDELFLTPELSWGIGARAEYVRLESISGAGLKRKTSFTDINPSTHLLYQFSEHLSVNAAVSRSVNRPKFDEIAPFSEEKEGDKKFVDGNPAVEPATAINFDLGMTYARKNMLFAVNLFHKEIDDVIEEADTGEKRPSSKDPSKEFSVFRVENVGDGWLRGIELEQRIDFSGSNKAVSGLSLWANESFLDSEVQQKKGGIKRPFNDQPDFIANFGFGYVHTATGLSLDVTGKYRSETEKFKADKGEEEKEKEHFTLDLGIRKTLGKNITLFVDVLNLTDDKKEKTKIKINPNNGERTVEDEVESSGTLYIVGIKGHF